MKFGMFVLPSWPQRDPSHQCRLYHEMIEQIQYAEELGFESDWLAEHHFTRFGIVPSALPLATYVAGQTKNIRIGTGVSVLNFHDPVFMAEETAMMDLLSDGRLDFGIGRGQVVYEYANFKVDYETRTQRFNEIVDIILGLWSTPGFTYHGDHYQGDDLTIAPTQSRDPTRPCTWRSQGRPAPSTMPYPGACPCSPAPTPPTKTCSACGTSTPPDALRPA